MKKTVVIAAVVTVLLGSIIGIGAGVGISIFSSPEYALKNMQKDIEENGMEALEFYLTGEALDFWESVETVTDNSLIRSILSILDMDNGLSVLKSELDEVVWTFDRMDNKRDDSVDVFLDFNYDDSIIGEIEFRMSEIEGEWLISKIEFPVFDKLEW